MTSVSTHAHSRNEKQNQTSIFQARETYLSTVASCPGLPRTALRCLMLLARMGSRSGVAWPRQQTLADKLGVARETICRALSAAEKQGLLRAERGRYGSHYYLPWHPSCRPAERENVTSGVTETSHLEAGSPIYQQSENLKAVVEAPPPPAAAQTPPPETAPSPPAHTAEETAARSELQRHSRGPVSYSDARRAIAAHGYEPVMHWAVRRRGDRLHHAGAVLAVLARDSQAEVEALAALAVLATPQETPALTPSADHTEATEAHQAAPPALPEGMTRADVWRMERAREERIWHRRRAEQAHHGHHAGAALESVGSLLSAYLPAGHS
jgi:hypothetical protein